MVIPICGEIACYNSQHALTRIIHQFVGWFDETELAGGTALANRLVFLKDAANPRSIGLHLPIKDLRELDPRYVNNPG